MSPIHILIADSQALICGALATLLGLGSDLKVMAQMGRGDEALDAIRKRTVDVALIDIDMPGRDGLAATAEIVGSNLPCRCLIVTTFGRPSYLSQDMETRAADFIVKDAPPEALAKAIREVRASLRVIDPELVQESVLLGPNPLTEREKEVLLAAATGADAREITTRLNLGGGTVRNYPSSTIAKTHVRNHAEAARTAETNGWL